jgi:hypothetical protein
METKLFNKTEGKEAIPSLVIDAEMIIKSRIYKRWACRGVVYTKRIYPVF